jgi:gluconokinase
LLEGRTVNVIVMGVAWTGRACVAAGLAEALGGRFIPGHTLHPPANLIKLARGEVLTPDDHAAWYDAMGYKIALRGAGTVIACSALRRLQRDRLRDAALGQVRFVHLHGPREVVEARMIAVETSRATGRATLDHQFRKLELPTPDENVLTVDISRSGRPNLEGILADLARGPGPSCDVQPRRDVERTYAA